ncbi:hypothetical protein HYC85_007211 [Camellia sinensis]|uniref:Vacuolar protein sorting-associated protein 54 N-terminal domain-containing protein n=1 Tax=Camellia sinensis TaxID=4442 RepID=A0A7J7HP77_CAMSI|nr:hypothetical protein HYC85_007211 [Camellia sinensis]
MPRQIWVVEGLIPGSCKIQKRGCSSSSSLSSVLQNYRFKRAISVGKPQGSRLSTSVSSWRTMAAALDSPKYAPSQSGGGRARPMSGRKLAATLWEMNEVPSPKVGDNLEEKKAVKREMRVRERMGVPRSVHSGSLPPHLSDPSHNPISEVVCDDTYREAVLDPTNELLVCTISGHCFDRFLSPAEMEPDTIRSSMDQAPSTKAPNITIDGEVVDAYALIGDVSGLAEKIQSFFMQEVLSVTHSVLKNILQEGLDPRATNHASRCMMAEDSNCTT